MYPYRSSLDRLKKEIRDVPDFPKPGVLFKDITPILVDAQLFRLAVTVFVERYQRKTIDKIAAIDARGFVFAGAVAHVLGVGLILIRKKGKLPYKTISVDYDLEYGHNTLEMHVDSVKKDEKVIIIDDVLATGGTAGAAANLVEKAGGKVVELAFLLELTFLNGRERLGDRPIYAAIEYP
ncbi:MAG: adenine phosphoribosyltransferase [Methylacidiphilales bacterium]|nr:adenine phosphoribosyltransferase [Candidatus Methylacidiphilales bacterium]MDW8349971.1 adenine phosphoribosyltransferase [Verrucomicrobiae bacterium]